MTARRYRISGLVQGVGFRYFAERVARELGITGWARNLADGTVEVHANGSLDSLNDFEARLRSGPPHADVRGFEVKPAEVLAGSDFRIR